jgi:hypothetical protein
VPEAVGEVREIDALDRRRQLAREVETLHPIDRSTHRHNGARRDPIRRRETDRARDPVSLRHAAVFVERRGDEKKKEGRSGRQAEGTESAGFRGQGNGSPPRFERQEARRGDDRPIPGRRGNEEKGADETAEGHDGCGASPARGRAARRGRGGEGEGRREQPGQRHQLHERPSGERHRRSQIRQDRVECNEKGGREEGITQEKTESGARLAAETQGRQSWRQEPQTGREEPDSRLGQNMLRCAREGLAAEKRESETGADEVRPDFEGRNRHGNDEDERERHAAARRHAPVSESRRPARHDRPGLARAFE